MTTALTVLIVTASLWAMVVATLLIVARLKSRSSTNPSPTPSTTPTPTSDASVQMLKMMSDFMKDTTTQFRETLVDLTQGRESPNQTGETETSPIWNERQIVYDYDSTPLSAGIEAVLERENQETEQARILRERDALQRDYIEAQAKLESFDLETSSETGPWNGSNPQHAKPEPPS